MVSGQHGAGEVVETPGARLAPVALPMRLGVVAPVADHRIAAATGAAHALGPAVLAHQREALGVVQQGREIDQIDGWHDGAGSSHEPVSYSRSRLQARPPSAPRLSPDPTTLKGDKSLSRKDAKPARSERLICIFNPRTSAVWERKPRIASSLK